MQRLPRSLIVLSALMALGCQDTLIQPDVDVSFAKGGKPEKPCGGGEDPPPVGPDGIVFVGLGVQLDGVINELGSVGAVRGGFSGVLPVGSVVQGSTVMDVGYLSEPGVTTNGAACFPFDEGYVRGTLSLTEDGSASAAFTFSGLAQDGVTNTQCCGNVYPNVRTTASSSASLVGSGFSCSR